MPETFERAQQLAAKLKKEGLRHIFVFSDGLKVNGTELIKGIHASV